MINSDAVLLEWPDVTDRRPLVKEDIFQTAPFKYAVNSNRRLYMDSSSREEFEKRVREGFDEIYRETMK